MTEHDALAAAAGATDLIRREGWIRAFRSEEKRDRGFAEAEQWQREFGLAYRALDARALRKPSRTSRRCSRAGCTGPSRRR